MNKPLYKEAMKEILTLILTHYPNELKHDDFEAIVKASIKDFPIDGGKSMAGTYRLINLSTLFSSDEKIHSSFFFIAEAIIALFKTAGTAGLARCYSAQ